MAKPAISSKANGSVPDPTQSGAKPQKPPPSNYGGNSLNPSSLENTDSRPSGSDRGRVNLSVPPGVDAVLARAADRLGMTRAQLALHLVVAGLPELDRIVRATDE